MTFSINDKQKMELFKKSIQIISGGTEESVHFIFNLDSLRIACEHVADGSNALAHIDF
jgi:hypothetical protein